jgi:peroxiredoxin
MRTFLTVLLGFFVLIANTQEAAKVAPNRKLDASTVVRDSSGTVYPYAIWTALLSKGYILKALDPKNAASDLLLIRLSDEEREARLSKMAAPRESKFFKTGDPFYAFKVRDMANEKINLKELRGKVVVLNFWFINCPPCRTEMPDLNNLVDSFATRPNVVFVSIALDSKDALEAFLKTNPFKYKVIENGRFLTERLGIKSYPTHVILDGEGKIAFHTSGLGPQTVYWLRKTINGLLVGSKESAQ